MKKIYFLAITLVCLVFIRADLLIAAENNLEVANNEVAGAIAYPLQWDIEALDFSLTPAVDDVLNALTIKNYGLSPDAYFEKIVLYADDGDGIFEGWEKDIKIGEGVYYNQNKIWHWKDLNIAVPKEGKRFFIAVETKNNGNILVDRRTIQLGIPSQYDENSNGFFDFSADMGIFMNSKNNGPQSEILNSEAHTIYKKTIDPLPPKSVITYPVDGTEISDTNITILGVSKDQGGSTPELVEINIAKEGEENLIWNEVVATGSNYITWEFEWNNIEDGIYIIKTKAVDWIGNRSEESGITVVINTISEEPIIPIEPEEPTEPKIQKPAGVNGGDLIRAIGDYKVYVVNGDYRRWIQSAEIFDFYGHFSFTAVKEISKAELEYYTESWLIRADGNEKVYEINSDGTKHWINMTAEQLTVSGRNWEMVYVVNNQERDFYATGADVLK